MSMYQRVKVSCRPPTLGEHLHLYCHLYYSVLIGTKELAQCLVRMRRSQRDDEIYYGEILQVLCRPRHNRKGESQANSPWAKSQHDQF